MKILLFPNFIFGDKSPNNKKIIFFYLIIKYYLLMELKYKIIAHFNYFNEFKK